MAGGPGSGAQARCGVSGRVGEHCPWDGGPRLTRGGGARAGEGSILDQKTDCIIYYEPMISELSYVS